MTFYCYPVPKGMKNFDSKENAEKHIEEYGGKLKSVPTFDTKEEVERWIQEQNNPEQWYAAHTNNVIGVDQNGTPLENQEYKSREPGEPFTFAQDLGKPDFEYFVEP